MSTLKTIATIAAAAVLTVGAMAQGGTGTGTNTQDRNQGGMSQNSGQLATELRAISFINGSWTGKSRMAGQAGAQPTEADTTIQSGMTLNNRYFVATVRTQMPEGQGGVYEGILLVGHDQGRYRGWWFSSMDAGPVELDGSLSGDRFVLTSRAVPGRTGEQMRLTFTRRSDSEVEYMVEAMGGQPGTSPNEWRNVSQGTFTKGPGMRR